MSTPFSLHLTTGPTDSRPVYVTGNFNDWNPADENFRLSPYQSGQYRFIFPDAQALPRPFLYKYTRGGWADAELDSDGKTVSNRQIDSPSGQHRDRVKQWDLGSHWLPDLTVFEGFVLPGLNRERRIRVLVPNDYEANPERRYPVLYLMDGQNLMLGGAGFGDWQVDRHLALLSANQRGELIVVAVDHGEEFRKSEYNPYAQRWLGKGEGSAFVNALTEGVKPFIDSHFRTLSDREHTGIGGSSMGGLLSLYAGLKAWKIFGKVLVFSPSLWVSGQIYTEAERLPNPVSSRFYLYGGGKEMKSMNESLERLARLLKSHPHVQTQVSFDPKGRHEEASWSREFPKAVEWLYF